MSNCSKMSENQRCRICMMGKSNQVNIFNTDMNLSLKIMEVADVQIAEDDGLPGVICVDCEADLEKCYEFKNQVQWADKKFREDSSSEMLVEEFSIKLEPDIHLYETGEAENTSLTEADNYDDEIGQEPCLKKFKTAEDENIVVSQNTESTHQPEIEPTTQPIDHIDILEDRIIKADFDMQNDPLATEDPFVEAHLKSHPGPSVMPQLKAESGGMSMNRPSPGPSTSASDPSSSQVTERRKSATSVPIRPYWDPSNMVNVELSKEQNCFSEDQELSKSTNIVNVTPALQLKMSTSHKEKVKTQQSKTTIACEVSNTNHEIETVDLFCEFCDMNFWSVELLRQHKSGSDFICIVCLETFKSHFDLENHCLTHPTFTCRVCKKPFLTRKMLYNHRKNSSSCCPSMACKFCKTKYSNLRSLQQHMRNFHESGDSTASYSCVVCAKMFKLPHQVTNHLKNVHTAYEYLECKHCQAILQGPDKLKFHIKFSHLNDNSSTTVACSTCGKCFNSRNLKQHEETHKDKTVHLCDICGKPCLGKQAIRSHMKFEHNLAGSYSCDQCDKKCNTLAKLKLHIYRTHKQQRHSSFVCEVCGQTFSSGVVLRTHSRIHSGEKPFKCDICGATFRQKQALRNHGRTHSDIGQYCCEDCGKSFKWKQTFDKHRNKCKVSVTSSEDEESPTT